MTDHVHPHDDHRRLAFALLLVASTALLELWGGLVTGSLALVADFGHMLSDVAALALALLAIRVAARAHTLQWTFGFHRAEVLAAAANGLGLLAIALFITVEAVIRLRTPPAVIHAEGLIAVATAGLLSNIGAALLLGHAQSLNMRAARLHVLFDLAGSVLAIVSGLVIAPTGWTRIDALLSLAIVGLLVVAAVRLLRGALGVLMNAVPAGIDLGEVQQALRQLPGVLAVHDVHCWEISSGLVAFAAHLEVAPRHDPQRTIEAATGLLRERFGIGHVTLQPELLAIHQPGTPIAPA